MYLSSYNGYGYSDKDKYCMRCPEKAAVTVKQENKEWIFKFSMVDWGVFSTWNPDPTGTGNTLIIEFRGCQVFGLEAERPCRRFLQIAIRPVR